MESTPTVREMAPAGYLRVAFVITELEPGGAERCLVELATRLNRALFSPVVYVLASPPPPERQLLVERLAAAAIPIHFLNLRYPWQYLSAVRQLRFYFREQAPHIVQTFLFHANVIGARAARAAGVPRIITGVRVADPRRWRTVVERWVTGHADRIVCVSQSVAHFCRRRGFSAQKLVVIPNGIDVARWSNAQPADLTSFGVPSGRRVFIYVGRLDEQKGLDQFFFQLPRMFEQLPDHDLLLVGEGKLQATLLRLAQQLGIDKRVHFAGWQPDIPSILARADVLVLPSRWEGMPNVVLEAMASAKPVVAAAVEGVIELLGDQAARQTVPASNFESMANRLVEVIHNSELAKDLGEKNRARAVQEFSLDSMAAKYVQLYRSLA